MYKLYWCESCKIPLIGSKCGICENKGKPIKYDFKPVFTEEYNLFFNQLKYNQLDYDLKIEDKKSKSSKKPILKKSLRNQMVFKYKSRIFDLNGPRFRIKTEYPENLLVIPIGSIKKKDKKKILNKKIDDFCQSNKKKIKNDKIVQKKKDKNNQIINNWDGKTGYEQKIIEANLHYLKEIEKEATDFIKKTMKKYPEKNYKRIISFSGGKDSTVTAYLVNRALNNGTTNKKIPLLFSNTSIEFPETVEFCEEFSQNYGNELIETKSGNDFLDLCQTLGPPSRVMRWCCSTQKAMPLNNYYRNVKGKVLSFDGIRRAESNLRSNYSRIKKNTKLTKQISTYPILDWKDFHVWIYILWQKIKFNPIYRKGYSRIGCWACPNNTKFDWILNNLNVPKMNDFKTFLLDYAKNSDKDEQWVYNGNWKGRRVHYEFEDNISKRVQCVYANLVFYKLNKPIKKISEFLKIFGKIIDEPSIPGVKYFIGDYSSGDFNADSGVINVHFNKTSLPKHYKFRFERQLAKASNCINCKSCVGVCPSGAIYFDPEFKIDETKCNGCLICTTAKYLNNACVALHYKPDQDKIEDKFNYNHPIPGDLMKNSYGFSLTLLKKLKELNLINENAFLKEEIENLIKNTGFNQNFLEKHKDIVRSMKTGGIIKYKEVESEEVELLQSIYKNENLVFCQFNFDKVVGETSKHKRKRSTYSLDSMECKNCLNDDYNSIHIEQIEDYPFNEDKSLMKIFKKEFNLQNPSIIYFESNPTKNRKIKDFLKAEGIDDNFLNLFDLLKKNFALPINRKEQDKLNKLYEIVSNYSTDEAKNKGGLERLQTLTNYVAQHSL